MAKISKKFIESGAVDESIIKLGNDGFAKGRNNADDGDVNIVKINSSDKIEFGSKPVVGAETLAYVSDIPSIPSVFELQGNWNANTNTPTLASSTNGTSATNPLYIVNVAGTSSIDGVSTWDIGAWIYFANGAWHKADNNDAVVSVAGKTGAVTLDTDDVAEGSNKYFTDALAKAAAVVNSSTGSETDQAMSVSASKSYVASQIATVSQNFEEEVITLSAGDITNGYVDLAQTPIADSLIVSPVGGLIQEVGTDYTLSSARVTFAGDLTSLESGDKVIFKYAY